MELENDIGTPIVDVAAGPLSRCSTCNLVVEGQLKWKKHAQSHQPSSTMVPAPSVAASWTRPTTPPDLSQLKFLSTYPAQVGETKALLTITIQISKSNLNQPSDQPTEHECSKNDAEEGCIS
eukprot:sb/3475998/